MNAYETTAAVEDSGPSGCDDHFQRTPARWKILTRIKRRELPKTGRGESGFSHFPKPAILRRILPDRPRAPESAGDSTPRVHAESATECSAPDQSLT
jgi:hypothetical protein